MSSLNLLLLLVIGILMTVDAGGWGGKKKSSGGKKKSSGGKKSGRGGGKKKSGKGSWWTPSPTPYPTEECVLTGVWRDEDDPDNRGDFETYRRYDNQELEPACPDGSDPQGAICRDVDTQTDFEDYAFGNYKMLYCDERGFLCRDNDNERFDPCPDFEVQFCCPP